MPARRQRNQLVLRKGVVKPGELRQGRPSGLVSVLLAGRSVGLSLELWDEDR